MIEELGGVTAAAVNLALDAAVVRHQVIANNVANVESPGFSPARLDFQRELATASATLDLGDDRVLAGHLDRMAGWLASPGAIHRSDTEAVELDREMVDLADNSIRYQALVAGLSKHMAIVRSAIEDTRP